MTSDTVSALARNTNNLPKEEGYFGDGCLVASITINFLLSSRVIVGNMIQLPGHGANKLPFPVSRHAAVSVGEDMAIIHTFKGVLTFKDGVLSEQPTKGDEPDSLSMCSMTAIGDKVVLFGGSDKKQNMSSDVYVLDTTNWTWTKLQCRDIGPVAMASASMAPFSKDQCIVFGGAGLAPTGYSGGYGLVPSADTWICAIKDKSVDWKRIECTKSPDGRMAASLNRLSDGRFLLQGGYDSVTKSTFEEPWILVKD